MNTSSSHSGRRFRICALPFQSPIDVKSPKFRNGTPRTLDLEPRSKWKNVVVLGGEIGVKVEIWPLKRVFFFGKVVFLGDFRFGTILAPKWCKCKKRAKMEFKI